MRFILVRHGQMAGDPYVEPECPVSGCLSDAGVGQAQATARELASVGIDEAFSSPYGRALQTAEIVMGDRDVPIRIIGPLKEWLPNPELKELPSTEYEQIVKQNEDMYAEEKWKTDLGEGCYDMYARMVPAFMEGLATVGIHNRMGGWVPDDGAEDKTVAVFAHGGTLNVLLQFILQVPAFPVGRFSFQLAGYADIAFSSRRGVYHPQLVLRSGRRDDDA